MPHDTTLFPPMVPGIRRIIDLSATLTASSNTFEASSAIPAGSILRTLLWAIDGTQAVARRVSLRIAHALKAVPVEADFFTTGIIIGFDNPLAATGGLNGSPANAAADFIVNLTLPNQPGRLIFRMGNANAVTVDYHLRLIVDSIAHLGANNERR